MSEGKRYWLTCVDRFTRWPEAFSLEDQEAETMTRAFHEGWICRFWTPLRVSMERMSVRMTDYVFIRHGWPKRILQLPYNGPFVVVIRDNKNFTIRVHGKNITVSIYRIKPGLCLQSRWQMLAKQPTTTQLLRFMVSWFLEPPYGINISMVWWHRQYSILPMECIR